MTTLLLGRRSAALLNDAAMLPRLTALLALALGLLRIAALSLHPDKLIADAPFSLADEVEYDARSIDLRSAAEKFERTRDPDRPVRHREAGHGEPDVRVGRDS